LPYVALTVFACGVTYRLTVWKRTPQPGKMTLYPSEGPVLLSVVKEALLFPSLLKGDKPFWLLAWSFHVALAVAFVGHFRVVTGVIDTALVSMGLGVSTLGALSAALGSIVGIVLLATASTLLLRRLFLARVREISHPPDFLALLLVVAVIASGDAMRLSGDAVDLAQTRAWAVSLLTFSPTVPQSQAFVFHVLFAETLILYIAFSKLMHFGGFFFTFPLIKRSSP
jgi:nitrate reductase gamma subunit